MKTQHAEVYEYHSQRLNYRSIVMEDLEEVRELHNHPEVIRRLTDVRPVSQLAQKIWFESISRSKSSFRIVVRKKQTSNLVGVFRLDKVDFLNQNSEIGLDVHPKFHRQGFGNEIYTKMFEILFNDWNMHRLYLHTLISNTPALSLYLKLGMKEEGISRESIFREGKFQDTVTLGLLRKDWMKFKHETQSSK